MDVEPWKPDFCHLMDDREFVAWQIVVLQAAGLRLGPAGLQVLRAYDDEDDGG